MRTLTAALMLAVVLSALPSPAGEQQPPPVQPAGPLKAHEAKAEATAKAERIAKVQAEITNHQDSLRRFTPEFIARERKVSPGSGRPRSMERAVEEAVGKLPGLMVELAWLKDELTMAKAEAEVKAAQEALDKAPDAGKAEAQKKLDEARFRLDQIKGLEEKERRAEF